jgi:ABC-type amino acid transport substrate-binding protein
MKKTVFLSALAAAGLIATGAMAQDAGSSTLASVKEHGALKCGVNTGTPGFAAPDANGVWKGFDIDLCRAVAAAIFGDPEKVEYTPLSSAVRFTALSSGEIDMLARNTTWTFSRDVDLKLEFAGVNYYDGQGFMVPKDLGVSKRVQQQSLTLLTSSASTVWTMSQFQLKALQKLKTSSLLAHVTSTQLTPLHLHQRAHPLKIQVTMLCCLKLFPKSHSARLCVTAIPNGATLCVGRSTRWFLLKNSV